MAFNGNIFQVTLFSYITNALLKVLRTVSFKKDSLFIQTYALHCQAEFMFVNYIPLESLLSWIYTNIGVCISMQILWKHGIVFCSYFTFKVCSVSWICLPTHKQDSILNKYCFKLHWICIGHIFFGFILYISSLTLSDCSTARDYLL